MLLLDCAAGEGATGLVCLTTRSQSRGLFRAKGKGDRGVEWNAYGMSVGKDRKESVVGPGLTEVGEQYWM